MKNMRAARDLHINREVFSERMAPVNIETKKSAVEVFRFLQIEDSKDRDNCWVHVSAFPSSCRLPRPYNARMTREDGPEGERGSAAPGGEPARLSRKRKACRPPAEG